MDQLDRTASTLVLFCPKFKVTDSDDVLRTMIRSRHECATVIDLGERATLRELLDTWPSIASQQEGNPLPMISVPE